MENDASYVVSQSLCCLRNIKRQTNDIFLVHCGIENCLPGHSWGPTARTEYHLHVIFDGKGVYRSNGNIYPLCRGQMFLIPPGLTTYYCADGKTPWHYAWVAFGGAKAAQYLEQAGLSDSILTRDTYIAPEEYVGCIKDILLAHELTYSNELKRVGRLFDLLALLIESRKMAHYPNSTPLDYPYQAYVGHALQFIQCNYSHIKVNDIAAYIGINRCYLSNIFKKALHVSPQGYLLNYRMDKAVGLLQSTDLPVRTVAQQVGYQDALSFSKMFKRIHGASPANFRAASIEREAAIKLLST